MAQGTPIRSVFYGGSQESGLRPGTEQVSFALGFAAALAEAGVMRTREAERLKGLREHFIEDVLSRLEGTVVNGTSRAQSPNILNISIPNIENEYVTLALDKEGFAIATKSACKEGEAESHVVRALSGSGDTWRARNALRVSFGRETTRADLHRFLHALSDIVRRTYKQRVIR